MANSTEQKISSNKGINYKPTYTIAWVIWLLSTAKKVRSAGLIFLLLAFSINCYFMLFDQQSYIVLLEYFSPDGKVSDIFFVFMKIQTLIIVLFTLWMLIVNQPSIDLLVKSSKTIPKPCFHWRHKKSPYIIACIIWLVISYLPFFFFDGETIKGLAWEDSFYENAGFIFLLFTSISFFYLFYREKTSYNLSANKTCRNIFFLLLGLLFFFGAGEEISWGQRIFHFHTPDILRHNIQQEFNLHNLPLFDVKTDMHNMKTGFIATHLSMVYLFKAFCFSIGIIIPFLYNISAPFQKLMDKINFPVPPLWLGLFFLVNSIIYSEVLTPIIKYDITKWPFIETREGIPPFIFLVIAVWFINNYKALNKS